MITFTYGKNSRGSNCLFETIRMVEGSPSPHVVLQSSRAARVGCCSTTTHVFVENRRPRNVLLCPHRCAADYEGRPSRWKTGYFFRRLGGISFTSSLFGKVHDDCRSMTQASSFHFSLPWKVGAPENEHFSFLCRLANAQPR